MSDSDTPAAPSIRESPDAGSLRKKTPRKRWLPEASTETAAVLRRLAVRPWLIAGRDDADIASVRRNLEAIRETLARLGWVLVVERDFMRLRKSPPVRRDAWGRDQPTTAQATWFFLLVAAAESMHPRVALASLVTAGRAAAAEIGHTSTQDISERRAIVAALKMLDDRGVVMQLDGNLEGFVEDEDEAVLLEVHHGRLAHVIAHFAPADPVGAPSVWLEQVEREADPARRMRQRLVDDTVVHVADLTPVEADWLSRRVRGDDGGPLASAFGLQLERRTEGAAFVVPDDAFRHQHELGPTPFPAPGTVPHAALLLIEFAGSEGDESAPGWGPGDGWKGLSEKQVKDQLGALARERANGQGGWRRELAEHPETLAEEIRGLLSALDLLRVSASSGYVEAMWWFSPVTGRWLSGSQSDVD
jgi:uncharacterized protein (TIGR02678 family)